MKTLETTTKYAGKILNLRVDRVELPSGRITFREIVEFPDTVTIVPVLGDSILLVRQERHAVGAEVLELPAGKVEQGESPAKTARRELEEETGYRARELKEVLSFYVTPGYSTEFMRLYIARGLERASSCPDTDEILEPVPLREDEAREMLEGGKFQDAKTILGLAFYFLLTRR